MNIRDYRIQHYISKQINVKDHLFYSSFVFHSRCRVFHHDYNSYAKMSVKRTPHTYPKSAFECIYISANKLYLYAFLLFWCCFVYSILFPRCAVINKKIKYVWSNLINTRIIFVYALI
jgi:hypothetical protein